MSDIVAVPKVSILKNKEFGDFQTPESMCDSVCQLVATTDYRPTVLIEPSCGKGNFIVSALKQFPSIEIIIAIELQEDYKEILYANILESNLDITEKKLILINKSFFEIDFEVLFKYMGINESSHKFLLLGNPPWVTNSFLGTISSANIPQKKNTKVKFKGLDALTGKSNFDIAETFIVSLLNYFDKTTFLLSMVCKTATVQNILKNKSCDLSHRRVSSYLFDAKKEFGVSASANVLVVETANEKKLQESICNVYLMYDHTEKIYSYGYQNNYFVSNVELYKQSSELEGNFIYQWRQGLKHDASSVLVLEEIGQGLYKNKLKEHVELESDLIYPFLKSSDIKKDIIATSRYHVLVTQQKLGEDTDKNLKLFPKIWEYVNDKKEYFVKRKSKIYNNQSTFCIFGIGDYSFKPYKIAISGFYKKLQFSLLLPNKNKPILVDDTCYILSFDSLAEALYVWLLLRTDIVQDFFSSITFLENKRPYKKDILQRLDFKKLVEIALDDELQAKYEKMVKKEFNISFSDILQAKNRVISNY